MSAKKKAAPRAVASARRAKIAYEPEIPLVRIDAMELALIRHIYSGEILECEPLSTQDAKEIKKAILLLKQILSRGKISPPVSRVEKSNLLATALARDIIRTFKCSRDNAVLAAFPNPKGRDVETLTRTYTNLLPKLAKTEWSVWGPSDLSLMLGYAAGLSKKPMSKEVRAAWGKSARGVCEGAEKGKLIAI